MFISGWLKRRNACRVAGEEGTDAMKTLIKSAMLWRFVGGFVAGGLGVLALHPATAEPAPAPSAPVVAAPAR